VRAAAERFARRWWGGELGVVGGALSLMAAPASWLWAGASKLRARDRAGEHATRVEGLRVISIGNLAVGGTGKTPVTAWVAGTVVAAGVPASVLVGAEGADEALLHRAWHPAIPVLAGRDRVASARQARAAGARVAILDDGYQHHALARDLDVVLLSADDPYPGSVLPRGPYRESRAALGRADVVLVTRRAAGLERARDLARDVDRELPGRVVASVHLAGGAFRTLAGASAAPPAGDVLAVCGVARPDAFHRAVAARVAGAVELHCFPDHHVYTAADVARLVARARGRPLVVTEKDAVKLRSLASVLGQVLVLADRLDWDWGEEALRARVLAVAASERAA
jgi:tetraacyldisaccharide 4'-kinase